ncbi:MAG: hypothetical protein ACK4GQ_03670 [Candidatus Hadarchaeales archaeon]
MKEAVVPRHLPECIVAKGIEIHELAKVKKETILYIQPCASERGRLMADIELAPDVERFFDQRALCRLLDVHRRRFSYLRCSENLGVAKFTLKGREVSVFRNGKLKIQRGLSREDLMKTASGVTRLVWPAVICPVCERAAVFCANGSCGKCVNGEEKIKIDEIEGAEILLQSLELLAKAGGEPAEGEQMLQRARFFALQFIVESRGKKDAAVGMKILADAGGWE